MKNTFKAILIATAFITLVGLIGCAPTYQVDQLGNSSNQKLKKNDSIYIALPKDGRFNNTTYKGSGFDTANSIRTQFSYYTNNITIGSTYQSKKQALQYARNKEFNYLVYPIIFHWESRATQWSGIPSRVTVQLSVTNINNGKLIDSAMLEGSSATMTFVGNDPASLLTQPIHDYAAKLYA